MYFEDEKDIIDESTSLHVGEDGTVSWEEILSDTADSGIEFIEDSSQDSSQPTPDTSGKDFNRDIEYVQDVEDAVSASTRETSSADNSSPTETYSSDENISDEFDIDKQLNQISEDGNLDVSDEFTMPSKEQNKNNSSLLVLFSLVLALLVAGGIYYYFMNFHNPNKQLVEPSTKTQMDNVTQEDIEQRNATTNNGNDADDEEEDAQIPIVNDDNVNELASSDAIKDEKKEIISVTPTGRPNPFLPLQKYAQADITETFVQYDRAGIPTPPLKMEKQDEDTVKMLTIAVSGIMYDKEKPSAIITLDENDYFVQKGDKLDDYRVIDIGPNYVTVALGKNLYKANVGEEFKISSSFYGSAQYMSQGQGGGRHYHSVSKDGYDPYEKKNRNVQAGGPRYVSEDEVEIKTK